MAVTVTINGKPCGAEKGEYLLSVARRNKILIPTMCHHEALAGLGACRLCVVEVNEGAGNKVVVSCVYPVAKDCEVFTESQKIQRIRKTIIAMLRDRAPEAKRIPSMAQIYKVPENKRFTVPAASDDKMQSACVLCGLCAHACNSLGTGAISTVGRGIAKKVSTPYDEASKDCIGCGSCAAVCPTGAIVCTEKDGERNIWGKTFKLLRCKSCGKLFATAEEYAYAQTKAGTTVPKGTESSDESECMCGDCKKKKSAAVFAAAFGITSGR
jgi:NADH dehydrogenase/NADH:ubiquinone oxidoreductase subunit G